MAKRKASEIDDVPLRTSARRRAKEVKEEAEAETTKSATVPTAKVPKATGKAKAKKERKAKVRRL